MSENKELSPQVKAIMDNPEYNPIPELLTQEETESELKCLHCGQPIVRSDKVCRFCGAPIQQDKAQLLKEVFKAKKPSLFDALTVGLLLVIWLAASGWIVTVYGVSWASIIGLAIFWLVFVFIAQAIFE
jgi:predicted RNA-binding Zn-ribbon protein involved in translation (DUF1610 family)